MSTLTDLFVANQSEIADIVCSGPSGRFPTVQAAGVDPVKLARLLVLLSGGARADDVALSLESTALLGSGGPEGPWVCRVPRQLSDALKEADDARITALASAWAATEEWNRDRATPGALANLLRDISSLVRGAAEDARLFLWMCA